MADKVVSVRLQAITAQYNAAMAQAAGTTSAFGGATGAAGKGVGGFGGKIGMVAPLLLGAGGLLAGLKSTTDAAIQWESSFAGVRKTVNGTETQLAMLSDGLREMSTEIPTTANELAGVAEAAGQLGVQTPNILGFTRTMADLGETTNLSANDAATSLARFANITGTAQTDFDRLGSVIVDLGNKFATTEAEIVEMGLRIAGAGAQIGLTEGEILGLATSLSSVGIEAQAGGTAISRVMIDMASSVATGSGKLETFARVANVSVEQFVEAWRDDPAAALTSFIQGLDRIATSGDNVFGVLDELEFSEVRVRDALLRSANAGELLATALETGNDAWAENVALVDEANKRYQTTEARLEMARNKVTDLKVEVGEGLTPALGDAADAFLQFFDSVEAGARGDATFVDRWMHGVATAVPGLNILADSARKKAGEFTDAQVQAMDAALDGREANIGLVASLGDVEEGSKAAAAGAQELTDAQTDLLNLFADFTTPLDAYDAALSAKEEAERASAEATAKATEDSSDSWKDYVDDVAVSIGEYLGELDKQVQAQEEWRANLAVIAARAGGEVALELADMGRDGVDLVAEFVNATDEELQRFAELLKRDAGFASEQFLSAFDISGALDSVRELSALLNALPREQRVTIGLDFDMPRREEVIGVTAGGSPSTATLDGRNPNLLEGRAMGGSVLAGRSYVVGENGPEILDMFGSGGFVTPLGGDGASLTPLVGGTSSRGAQATDRGTHMELHEGAIQQNFFGHVDPADAAFEGNHALRRMSMQLGG